MDFLDEIVQPETPHQDNQDQVNTSNEQNKSLNEQSVPNTNTSNEQTEQSVEPVNEQTVSNQTNDVNVPNGPDTSVPGTTDVNVPNGTNGTNGTSVPNGTNTEDKSEKPKYTKIVATYSDESEVPEGTNLLSVAEFASEISVRNIKDRGMGPEGIVKDAAIYTAAKAARHPLPVVMVGTSALIPWDLGLAAWDSRPVRGEGSGTATGGRLDDDQLLIATGRALWNLERRQEFVKAQQEKLAEAVKLSEKRLAQLNARNLNVEDANKAFVEWKSEQDAKKEIPDDNTENKDNSDIPDDEVDSDANVENK